jgi:hypothetical protein
MCTDPGARGLWVKNLMSRDVTGIDLEPLQLAGSINLPAVSVPTVGEESLPANVLLGKRIFYHASDPRMSGEGYLSCATCHLDGGHDGRVWDFTGRGEGFRTTTTLRGRGGMGQGNVHWTATFDEIQDFEGDIRGAFGGTGFMSNADFDATSHPLGPPKAGLSPELDALADYVASLGRDRLPRSPHRNPDGTQTAAGVAGRTVIQNRRCASCHAPPEFTDSTRGAETERERP